MYVDFFFLHVFEYTGVHPLTNPIFCDLFVIEPGSFGSIGSV